MSRYKFNGDNPVRLCNWNAHVNRQLGNFSLAYTWKLIGILVQQAEIYKPPPLNVLDDSYFEYIESNKRRRNSTKEAEEQEKVVESDTELNTQSGGFQSSQEITSHETDLFYNSEEFKMTGLPGGGRCLEIWQRKQLRYDSS